MSRRRDPNRSPNIGRRKTLRFVCWHGYSSARAAREAGKPEWVIAHLNVRLHRLGETSEWNTILFEPGIASDQVKDNPTHELAPRVGNDPPRMKRRLRGCPVCGDRGEVVLRHDHADDLVREMIRQGESTVERVRLAASIGRRRNSPNNGPV